MYVFKLLSWASSNIITEYCFSSGSERLSRSRTPSVRYLWANFKLLTYSKIQKIPFWRLRYNYITWWLSSLKSYLQNVWHNLLLSQASHQVLAKHACALTHEGGGIRNNIICSAVNNQKFKPSYRDTETAATRRGWVTAMQPDRVYPFRWRIWESWVLLPEPVSPIITATGLLSTVSAIFSSNRRIGRRAFDSIQFHFARACLSWEEGRDIQELAWLVYYIYCT